MSTSWLCVTGTPPTNVVAITAEASSAARCFGGDRDDVALREGYGADAFERGARIRRADAHGDHCADFGGVDEARGRRDRAAGIARVGDQAEADEVVLAGDRRHQQARFRLVPRRCEARVE